MDGKPAPAEEWAERRSDARRNHERVLAAAVEVFTEHGLDATIPQVAARAGVGKATVYRSYPTKADLVRALAMAHLDWLNDRIREAADAAETDAYGALTRCAEEIFARLAQDRLMIEVLGGVEGIENDPKDADALTRILRLGVEQGSLREDVTDTDAHVMLAGVARALLDLETRDPDVWRRYAGMAIAALHRRPAP